MRSDAYITVTCDGCGNEIEIKLTTTARGYDERGVNGELEIAGWMSVDGGATAKNVPPKKGVNMWKKVSEELPPPFELVLLQLTGDEYVTGWYSPHLEVWAGNGKSPWRIEDCFVEKWCEIVRPYDDAPDVDHLLRTFWAILEGALKHNDGAPLWANSTTTAFEALAELAHDYAPDVAREFQERLDSDW